jgi:hypothetical protein
VSRRAQVLPFTLSELFALLFFALALALAYQTLKRQQLEEEARALEEAVRPLGVAQTRAVAQLLAQQGGAIPEDFQELVRRVERSQEVRPQLESALRAAGVDSSTIAHATTQELLEALVRRQQDAAARADALTQAAGLDGDGAAALERAAEQRAAAERENRELRGQVAYLSRRAGTGMDHPPCWADEHGRPEYAYEARIHTHHVDLIAVWPPHRAVDARSTPGMLDAPGTGLGYAEFSRRALPVFQWSRAQDPQCRHFVRIVDRVEGGKEPFKHGLLTVERYFYKLLVD